MKKRREPNIEVHRTYSPDMERMVQALRILKDYNPKHSKEIAKIETNERTG